jgi:hypothetical protein
MSSIARMARVNIVTALTAVLAFSCADGTARRTLSPVPAPRIGAVVLDSRVVQVNEPVTLSFPVNARFDNPFDAREIRVDGLVRFPDGRGEWIVPAFYYQDYSADWGEDGPVFSPQGEAHWQLRLSLPKPGKYKVRLSARDRYGLTLSTPIEIEAIPATDLFYREGVIRVHNRDPRYFMTEEGRTWFPVGFNVCWGEFFERKRGIFAYPDWFEKMADAGCNYSRLWLSPSWSPFSLRTPDSGYDRIDLLNAWRLDYVVKIAEKNGIRLKITIDSFNILRSKDKLYGTYEDEPDRVENGGPIRSPLDYFTNADSRAAYQNRLRNLVARYGHSPAVFAWEFWNEVDLVDEYDGAVVREWHQTMAEHLRSLDPWKRPMTTSYSDPKGDPLVEDLPQLDFVQTHLYVSENLLESLGEARGLKLADRLRPHFHGEFNIAVGDGPEVARRDPHGIHIHNAVFASIGQMQAGTPMSWWWDSYIDPQGLYSIYRSFNAWKGDIDLAAGSIEPLLAHVELSTLPDTAAAKINPPIVAPYSAMDSEVYSGSEYGMDYGDWERLPFAGEPRVLGVEKPYQALAWVYNAAFTWSNYESGAGFEPIKEATLVMRARHPGKWRVQFIDPRTGEVIGTRETKSARDGLIRLPLPVFTWDIALRLFLIEPL